jgi:hypothetical protein
MSVVLRFIDNTTLKSSENLIQEYFIGLVPLQSFDAPSLANAIVDLLRRYNIDLSLCIGLCFDG